MSIKQRLVAFFFCVDCNRFTLTGWFCRSCGSRLCFECAGGYAMFSLHSPGFEMCETCKDDNDRAIRANFPIIKSDVHGYRTQKRRCTGQTPLHIPGISRRLFTGLLYKIGHVNIKRTRQSKQGFSSWHTLSILNSANGININASLRGKIHLCHKAAFSYFSQAKFCSNWSLSRSAHVIKSPIRALVVAINNSKAVIHKFQAHPKNVRVFTLTN